MIAERHDAPGRTVAAVLRQPLQMIPLPPLAVWIASWWAGRSAPKHERSIMMNHAGGWMSGWLGGGMWIWALVGVLVVVLLVVAIIKLTKK